MDFIGDEFLKFQDHEEVTSMAIADAFEQMYQQRRYVFVEHQSNDATLDM
jgi:GPI-anchor transamidase subunit K